MSGMTRRRSHKNYYERDSGSDDVDGELECLESDNYEPDETDGDSDSRSEDGELDGNKGLNVIRETRASPSPKRNRNERVCSKRPKRKFLKYYNSEWEKSRPWLKPSPKGRAFFRCTSCHKDGKSTLFNVDRHARSVEHVKAQNMINSIKKNAFQPGMNITATDRKLKIMDIRLCMYLVEHNNSGVSIEHLVLLFKSSFKLFNPLNTSIDKWSCARTKATAIIQNVLGKSGEAAVLKKLREQYFALMIDESTDISSDQHLALVVRTFDEDAFAVRDEFLTLTDVTDRTAKGLHKAIIDYFHENDVPYITNMKAFGADNAATMVGSQGGVAELFKKEIPSLIIVRCFCHWLALCSNDAAKCLPGEVDDLLHRLIAFFNHSGKRMQEFEEVLKVLNMDVLKILKKSPTRWLSFSACIRRIVQLLPALKKYFAGEIETLTRKFKLTTVETTLLGELRQINDLLQNPLTRMYLGFLSYVLPVISNLNAEFQSEKPQVFGMHEKVAQLRRTMMKNYMKSCYVHDKTVFQKNGHNNCNYYSPLCEVFAGPDVEAFLTSTTVSEQKRKEFFTCVQNFYVTFLDKLFQQFPLGEGILKTVNLMNPENLRNIRSLSTVAAFATDDIGIDLFDLDEELQLLQSSADINFDADVLKFYRDVSKVKRGSGEPVYKNIMKLFKYVLVIPHSTATVERIFSAINLNKTKVRNRVKRKTIMGILHAKNTLKVTGSNCFQYEVPLSVIALHNKNMYDSKNEETFVTDQALFQDASGIN